MEIMRYSTLLLALLFYCSAVSAQQEAPFLEQAQKKFEYGLLQFELSHWESAAKQFEEIARKYPLNHRSTAAYIMAARAFLLDGQSSVCLRLIEELQKQFPASNYLSEGYLIAGDAAVAAGSRSTALRWYVQSWLEENSDRPTLTQRIESIQPETISTGEWRTINELLSRTPHETDLLAILHRENQQNPSLAAGSQSKAKPTAQERFSFEAPRIAVALPLHEKDPLRSGIVRDIRDGILAALDIHRAIGKKFVTMELLDSGDDDSLHSAIDRLEKNERAMVLIAGAFSEDAERVSRIAAERGLLVLIPTATAEGLTKLGSNIFQLNTPILQRARLLAEYSYLELDAQEAIVISPDQSYARDMADAFADRCRALKIPVKLAGMYGNNGEGMRNICAGIKLSGAKKCILFAPVQSRDDIVAVLEGIREAQLNIPIVGGGNWNHPDLLALHGKGMTLFFESDVVEDKSSEMYSLLREAFANRSSRQLSREALFGFDAMQIALSLIDDEQCTRKSVRTRIANVFDGLRAPVNFMMQRVNASINILRCQNGVISKQEAFHAK
jgi:ABC-type branched-subunit amino acid transport system substrate-binding protein